ncbi:unnamed protein product [Effrenium voratum]|uniref:Pentatricopeptide repeat-containing protein, chloroplastic n=1 Tax=Effrenium voratum TaxID=2562239 RepID=A0AA36HU46_9DINO|nr:unnamed protein product [Effrenium voratum]
MCWPKALAILDEDLPLDVFACGALVRVCARWDQALAVVAEGLARRIAPNTVVCNTAISACAKGSQWPWCLQLMQDMATQRLDLDVITFSSLINAYAQSQRWQRALEVLASMPEQRAMPNLLSYSAAMTAASEEAWPWALQLLSELPRAALRLDAVCCSAAMCALGRGQKWQCCLELALGMGKVSQITGNTLVTAFQRSTQWTWVLCLLEQMESRTGNLACGADVITYASAIAACGDAGRWEACLELFARSEGSPAVLNAAIAGCGQSSQWQRSMQLLRGEVLPDIISYNSAITACGNAEQWQQAQALLWEIPNQVPKDVVTLNAVLSCGLPWLLALQLFLELPKCRLEANSVSCNSAVTALGSQWRQSLAMLQLGARRALAAEDVVGRSAALSACERRHEWRQAMLLLQQMWTGKGSKSLVAGNAMLAAYEKVDRWSEALQALSNFPRLSLQPDEVSLNSCCSSAEKCSSWRFALQLLRPADLIGFNLLLRSCMHSSDWRSALRLLHLMRSSETGPSAMSIVPAIEACAREGEAMATAELLEELQLIAVQ